MPIASVILANTATRLMFVQLPYLLIGNLFIGLIEGLVLIWLFKASKRAIGLMIVANYLSMFVGLALFGLHTDDGLVQNVWRPTIVNYQFWIAAAIGLSIVVSVLVEWPFCHGSFKKGRWTKRKTFAMCGLIQTMSYLFCLAPFSGMFAEIRIREEVEIVDLDSIVSEDLQFQVYFIDPDDGDIYRMRPNGSNVKHFQSADLENGGRLRVYVTEDEKEVRTIYDLYARRTDRGELVHLVSEFASRESAFLTESSSSIQDILNLGLAADLTGIRDGQSWRARMQNYWGIAFGRVMAEDPTPIKFIDSNSEQDFSLMFTTAFGTWQGRNASILPGDLVIFEFGGQICALDLNQRKLALICMGYGPVVVRDEPEIGESEQSEDLTDELHDARDPEAALDGS
ncbi:MAG: hypothetical protein O7G85_08550 [Planctomycetota bacterium]|nr:hypothetical protein [Planctomycetota bacterium]